MLRTQEYVSSKLAVYTWLCLTSRSTYFLVAMDLLLLHHRHRNEGGEPSRRASTGACGLLAGFTGWKQHKICYKMTAISNWKKVLIQTANLLQKELLKSVRIFQAFSHCSLNYFLWFWTTVKKCVCVFCWKWHKWCINISVQQKKREPHSKCMKQNLLIR